MLFTGTGVRIRGQFAEIHPENETIDGYVLVKLHSAGWPDADPVALLHPETGVKFAHNRVFEYPMDPVTGEWVTGPLPCNNELSPQGSFYTLEEWTDGFLQATSLFQLDCENVDYFTVEWEDGVPVSEVAIDEPGPAPAPLIWQIVQAALDGGDGVVIGPLPGDPTRTLMRLDLAAVPGLEIFEGKLRAKVDGSTVALDGDGAISLATSPDSYDLGKNDTPSLQLAITGDGVETPWTIAGGVRIVSGGPLRIEPAVAADPGEGIEASPGGLTARELTLGFAGTRLQLHGDDGTGAGPTDGQDLDVVVNRVVTYGPGDTLAYDITLPDGSTLDSGTELPVPVRVIATERPTGALVADRALIVFADRPVPVFNDGGTLTPYPVDSVTGAAVITATGASLQSVTNIDNGDGTVTVTVTLDDGSSESTTLPAQDEIQLASVVVGAPVDNGDGTSTRLIKTQLSDGTDLPDAPFVTDNDTILQPTGLVYTPGDGSLALNYIDGEGVAQQLTATVGPFPDTNTTNATLTFDIATRALTILDSDGGELVVTVPGAGMVDNGDATATFTNPTDGSTIDVISAALGDDGLGFLVGWVNSGDGVTPAEPAVDTFRLVTFHPQGLIFYRAPGGPWVPQNAYISNAATRSGAAVTDAQKKITVAQQDALVDPGDSHVTDKVWTDWLVNTQTAWTKRTKLSHSIRGVESDGITRQGDHFTMVFHRCYEVRDDLGVDITSVDVPMGSAQDETSNGPGLLKFGSEYESYSGPNLPPGFQIRVGSYAELVRVETGSGSVPVVDILFDQVAAKVIATNVGGAI